MLRRWRSEDLAPFAELNADPAVMAHMQKTLRSREESDAFASHIEAGGFEEYGFGLWAVEVPRSTPRSLGSVGLAPSAI